MVTVKFKPVCECGYIFKSFEYDPDFNEYELGRKIRTSYMMEGSHYEPEYCPKCGQRICNFTIPVFYQNGKITYKE